MAVYITQSGINDNVLLGIEDDLIYASTGNDTINGGTGIDTVDYNGPFGTPGVVNSITLKPLGVVDKGVSGTDQLIGIETIIGNIAAVNTIDSSTATGAVAINVNLSTEKLLVSNPGIPGFPLSFTVKNFRNVQGTANNDTITGNALNNLLNGNAGNDTIDGGAGNDTIDGGAGNDSIIGGLGNDSTIGGVGNDTIDGGAGVDTVNYTGAFGISIKPLGVVDKGVNGTDTLIGIETITGNAGFVNTIDSSTSTGITSINANLATNSLVVSNATIPGFPLTFTVNNFRNVQGTANNDTITGNALNNVLNGNAGNDTIDGGAGNDTIDGGAGNDSIIGGLGNDSTIGGVGNDTIDGGAGVDTVNYTGAFGISIKPLGVVDKGVNGTDTLIGIETITGNAGFVNTIDSSASTGITSINANLATNSLVVSNATIPGFPLTFTVNNFRNVQGTANNDTITGNALNNVLNGNAGNDTIDGGAGNDTINGGAGNDSILGGLGNDSAIGGVGNDTIDGGAGVDTVNYTGAFGISIKPLGVVDKGVNGTDTLIGIETITGNAGFVNTINSSASTGITSINVDLGINKLVVNNSTIPGFPLTFTVNNFRNVQGTANNDAIVGDFNANLLNGNAGNDNISGNLGNDTINGGDGNDQLNGGDGDDRVIGGNGDDQLNGGAGNDVIDGNLGNDATLGGTGNDTIDGGLGNDSVSYSGFGITIKPLGVVDKGTNGTDQLVGIETITSDAGFVNTIDSSASTGITSINANLATNSLVVSNATIPVFPLPLLSTTFAMSKEQPTMTPLRAMP